MNINRKMRTERSIKRLEEQLNSGVKPEKVDGKTTNNRIPLTDKDRTRIETEIANAKSNISGGY